jgi:uncharacterized membrane protein YvbJ
MKKKIILAIIAVIIVIILIIKLIPNEKTRFKNDIKALKSAVEHEDRTETFKYIDTTYLDRYNMSYEEFVNIIDNFFEQVEDIKIVISGMKVRIDSSDAQNNIFASCSLGLKVFAKLEDEKVLIFGGIIKPAPVRGWFKKSDKYYKVYAAEY